MDDFIQIKNISKKYDNKFVIMDLSMSIPSGRIIGLLGDNGIGKTTLLKLLGNLQKPDRGEIRIDNTPLNLMLSKDIVYLLEPANIYDWMNIKQAIAFHSDFQADFDKGNALRLCREFGLDLHARVNRLSKGNKEKVCLMLAFSRTAKLYLMDEPLGGIDPTLKKNMKKFILENIPTDATIIMATHLIKDLEVLFDQVIIMTGVGKIIYVDTDEIRRTRNQSIEEYYSEVIENAAGH
jgi:ABC-2 type transport system ATP-binding protein